MTVTLTTTDRAALTLLVLPVRTLPADNLWQAYPIDLEEIRCRGQRRTPCSGMPQRDHAGPARDCGSRVRGSGAAQHLCHVERNRPGREVVGGRRRRDTGVLAQLVHLVSVVVPAYA